jgi:ABC-type glycerol-3-phosphate transport system permease component/peptidoglycan/LPS O-acetylase OafA/YrhL
MLIQPMSSASSRTKPKRSALHSRSAYLFIAPFFLLLILFAFAPLLMSLVVSLMEWNPSSGLGGMRFDGLWAFNYTLQDSVFWQGWWRSLRLALTTAITQHLIAIPLAFMLHIAFKRVQGMVATIIFVPFMTSSLAAGAVLSAIFAIFWALPMQVSDLLQSLPLIGSSLPSLTAYYNESAAAFTQLWTVTGWNVLLYLMVLNIVPRSLYEAAQLDGAGFWRLFWNVALPMMRPMIFVAFTMSFLRGTQTSVGQWFGSISDIRNIDLPTYIIRTAFWDTDFGLASAQTWVFFAGIALITLVFYWFFGRNFTLLETTALGESDSAPLRFSTAWRVAMKLLLLGGLALCLIPILNLLLAGSRSYSSGWLSVGDAWQGNYALLLEAQPTFLRNLWNSAYIATLASLGAVLISSLAGFAFALLEFRGKAMLYGLVLSVMLFPSLMNLIPTAVNMALLGWIDQARAVWVPGVVSAFGVFLLRQYVQGAVPKSLLEAARIDGANDFRIYFSIMLPLARPALATLGLVTFVTVWNNNSVALALLKSPEQQMVSQILSYMNARTGLDGAYLIGTAISSLVPLVAFLIFARQISLALNIAVPVSEVSWWSRVITAWRNRTQTRIPSQPLQPISSQTLIGADGIRAIGCLMVIFHHLWQRFDSGGASDTLKFFDAFLEQGSAGVSAFFVLSGMLLAIPFWRAYLNQKPMPDMLEYTRRRAVRIVPGFYASLIVSFLLGLFFAVDGEKIWWRLVSALSFTSAFSHVTFFPAELNGPLWSIGFEVFCYILMPLGMWVLFTQFPKRGFWFAVRYWLFLLGLVFVANHLIRESLVPDNVNRGWEHGLLGGAKYWMPNYNAIGMFAHYLLGVLAAGFIVDRRNRAGIPSAAFDAVAILAFVGMFSLLWFSRGAGDFGWSFQSQPYRFPWFPACVAILLVTLPFSRIFGRILDNTFFRYTAKISFGLYIWHFPILECIRLLHNSDFAYGGIQDPLEFFWLAGLGLGLAYVAAAWSYQHIELPFLGKEAAAPQKSPSASPISVQL